MAHISRLLLACTWERAGVPRSLRLPTSPNCGLTILATTRTTTWVERRIPMALPDTDHPAVQAPQTKLAGRLGAALGGTREAQPTLDEISAARVRRTSLEHTATWQRAPFVANPLCDVEPVLPRSPDMCAGLRIKGWHT